MYRIRSNIGYNRLSSAWKYKFFFSDTPAMRRKAKKDFADWVLMKRLKKIDKVSSLKVEFGQ